MLIGLEKRFVFVANTKTASTSIEKVLLPYAEIHHAGTPQRKHVRMPQLLSLYHEEVFGKPGMGPETFFKFGVMRDPIEWIGSWFRYRKGNKTDSPLPPDMSFAEFWAQKDWNILLANKTRYLQRHMFLRASDEVLVDMILPYERLGEMFAEICRIYGIHSPLPRENVSRLPQEVMVPPELEDEVRSFYARDYALRAQLDEINEAGRAHLDQVVARLRNQSGV